MPNPSRLLAIALILASVSSGWAADVSPVGTWRTFDDGGKETGVVTIQAEGGVLTGRVTGIADPARAQAFCQHCPGDRSDLPVIGLQIIRGVKADGDGWGGGEILDPETGRVYRVKMHTEAGGAKLVLRGFIGISVFGRSQTWLRRSSL